MMVGASVLVRWFVMLVMVLGLASWMSTSVAAQTVVENAGDSASSSSIGQVNEANSTQEGQGNTSTQDQTATNGDQVEGRDSDDSLTSNPANTSESSNRNVQNAEDLGGDDLSSDEDAISVIGDGNVVGDGGIGDGNVVDDSGIIASLIALLLQILIAS